MDLCCFGLVFFVLFYFLLWLATKMQAWNRRRASIRETRRIVGIALASELLADHSTSRPEVEGTPIHNLPGPDSFVYIELGERKVAERGSPDYGLITRSLQKTR